MKRLEKKLDGNYKTILRAVLNEFWEHLYKIAAVRTLTSHHSNHQSKTNKTCKVSAVKSKDEPICIALLWTATHGHTSVNRAVKTHIYQLCADTGCCQEDLPRAMNDRDGWRERVNGIRTVEIQFITNFIHKPLSDRNRQFNMVQRSVNSSPRLIY